LARPRNELDTFAQLDKFLSELKREWAIETGQIEGVYDIDRGVTATLIERGIDADLKPRVDGQKIARTRALALGRQSLA
jgi:hypothetical protein